MFDNVFGSFQDAVAKAKEERERLDQLLTVSTPRERGLVGAVAVLLLVFGAWLFFGNVPHSVALEGVLAEPVEGSMDGGPSVEVLAWIANDGAPVIEAGMRASVELHLAGSGRDTLHGTIAAVSTEPVSERLATLEAAAPVSVRRFEITLDAPPDPASLPGGSAEAGMECHLVVELAPRPPVALFRMRPS